MKAAVVGVVVLWVAVVAAQEIGTEIPNPPPASSGPGAQYDDPYAHKGQGAQTPAPPPPPMADPRSAGRLAFGLRGSFSLGPTVALLGGATLGVTGTMSASSMPSVGLSLFVVEKFRLTADLGLAMAFNNGNTPFGFLTVLGAEPVFRSSADALRPFLTFQFGFGKLVSIAGDDFVLLFNAGGGGEYFFSPNFSVNVRVLLAAPFNVKGGVFALVTASPGIGATVYF